MATNQVNVDPKIIKNTQDTLGKIIKKPVLTEKLLKRPPFKFLHDIIINVSRFSNYLETNPMSLQIVAGKSKSAHEQRYFFYQLILSQQFIHIS